MRNHHITRSALCGVLMVCALAAQAADQGGRFSVRGVGLLTCEAYNTEREGRTQAYQMIGGWIDGFITATNASLAQTYDVMSYQSTELLAEVVHSHCASHPQHRLFEVLTSITRQKLEDRLQVASPLNKVVVADKEAYLYAATILRMQQRLVARGLLEEAQLSGQFSRETALALQNFQASHDFEATGFPDQATLWMLFES